jgi:hypothetical protein
MEQNTPELWENKNILTHMQWSNQKETRAEEKQNLTGNFSQLLANTKPQIQEAHRTPNRKKVPLPVQVISKLQLNQR